MASLCERMPGLSLESLSDEELSDFTIGSLSEGQSDFQEAQQLTKEYLRLLTEWTGKRESTVEKIREIASGIDNVQDEEFTKAAASVIGAAGGLMNRLAKGDIIGISERKLDEAQKIFDEEKRYLEKSESYKDELDTLTDQLCEQFGVEKEQVLGALLISTISERLHSSNPFAAFKILTSVPKVKHLLQDSFSAKSALGREITESFAMIAVKGALEIIGTVLKDTESVALLEWDVYSLFETAIKTYKGSKSESSNALRLIGKNLEKQTTDLKRVLKEIEQKTIEHEAQIKGSFRKRLEQVSASGQASDEDANVVLQYINMIASQDWMNLMNMYSFQDQTTLVFWIARIFDNIYRAMEQYLNLNDPQRQNHLNISVIGHGRIDRNRLPCLLHYLSPGLTSITLYEPWGCEIDTTVGYGIVTNRIVINNVQYSGPVYPGRPVAWNVLPRCAATMIPRVTFSPVLAGEDAHQALLELDNLLQHQSDGLVIPYFTGMGTDILPFPEVPLWVISNTVSILSHIFGVTCSIRVAACLVADATIPEGTINFGQYHYVDIVRPHPVQMSNGLPIQDQLMLNLLNRLRVFAITP